MKRRIRSIDYSRKFDKRLKKVPVAIRRAFRNRLALFLEDPTHAQLRNHVLTGRWKGHRSINVTGDWRAIFSEKQHHDGSITILFVDLGTHSQLYR